MDEVIEYLVAHGADIDARDFRGRTAYRMAEGSKQSFQFQTWPETAELVDYARTFDEGRRAVELVRRGGEIAAMTTTR